MLSWGRARIANENSKNESMNSAAALEIEHLRIDYGHFTAVDDLSLTVGRGEIFGLVGPNGAGKTSLIRVLATLLEPTEGEVRIGGYDLFEAPDEIHAVLGYMPDLAPVVPDLKVWEFLDLYAASYGFVGTEKRDRVDSGLRKVGLDDHRDAYGGALSRGMSQRVVLAKTLLHEPSLLLLDEPASGMDVIARRDLRRVLEEVAGAGTTVLISSHILTELADMCTSVGIMHLGRLLGHGPLDTIVGSVQRPSVEIRLEVLDEVDTALDLLRAREDVESVRRDGTRLTFTFAGDRSAQAALLGDLMRGGARVSAFTPSKSNLEALLMSLIEAS